MNVLGSFVGTTLFTAGLLIFLYSLIPFTGWVGILLCISGGVVLVEFTRVRILKHGLKGYLPAFVDEYMTRTDLVDLFVRVLRENGAISKMFRLMSMIQSIPSPFIFLLTSNQVGGFIERRDYRSALRCLAGFQGAIKGRNVA